MTDHAGRHVCVEQCCDTISSFADWPAGPLTYAIACDLRETWKSYYLRKRVVYKKDLKTLVLVALYLWKNRVCAGHWVHVFAIIFTNITFSTNGLSTRHPEGCTFSFAMEFYFLRQKTSSRILILNHVALASKLCATVCSIFCHVSIVQYA